MSESTVELSTTFRIVSFKNTSNCDGSYSGSWFVKKSKLRSILTMFCTFTLKFDVKFRSDSKIFDVSSIITTRLAKSISLSNWSYMGF